MKINLNFLTNKIFLIIFLLGFVLYHLLTLSISPIVWQDETFFNSITLDFINNHTFNCSADPTIYNGMPHFYYGPVFFTLNGFILSLFGNNPFFARLLGLLSGFIILLTIVYFYKHKLKGNYFFIILILALFLDPFFNASMHKGRNDTLALMFYFLSFLMIFKNQKGVFKISNSILSAIFFSLTILTTSRMLIFAIAFVVYFLILFIKETSHRKKIFVNVFIWGATVAILYSIWIFYAFGGYIEYTEYYLLLKNLTPTLLFGDLFIPVEEYPLIISFICLMLFVLFKNWKILTKPDFWFLIVHLIVFYLLVGDVGPYSILVVPVYYLIFVKFFNHINFVENKNRIFIFIISMLFLFNLSVFLLKSVALSLNIKSRNYSEVNNFIKSNISAESKVVADEVYYYAVTNDKCKFQYIITPLLKYNLNEHLNTIEKYRREVFDYEYLVISNRLEKRKPQLMNVYEKNSKLIKIAEFKTQRSALLNFLNNFHIYDFSSEGYDGRIYKRIK